MRRIAAPSPDAQGVFHGCANKQTGALCLVRKAGNCRARKRRFPGELAVQWSRQGAPGAAGPGGHDGTTVVARPAR